jgi:DNA-binding CsgD family transcriptional regulator
LNALTGSGLVDRRTECELLNQVLADVRSSHSRVLVLRGEAGVGKTALMDYLARTSSGCRVVRAAGVESEMELPFAGVHQVCASILDRVESLPGPQRVALSTAFGLVAGEAPDRFLVGLAVLHLLSAVAEQQPLICLIEDAQWLDGISSQTLTFVARRLLAESVALVFAVREPSDVHELKGLPEHTVGGLSEADARVLLDSANPVRLDDRVRNQIIAETRGNPLALLELPRGFTAGELAGGFALPGVGPLAGHIEASFVRRIQSLPRQTQQLLLTAAAEPLGDATLLWRAARRLEIHAAAEAPAEEDGLIEFGARVRFRHPLVRSAAYRAGTIADRRAAHLALAEVTDPQLDPDRRAWHRAQAAPHPDEDVAAELERSAARAQSRGGIGAAAAFLERATALTVDPAQRSTRALAAAQAKFGAGAFGAADELITTAEIGPIDELQVAKLALLRAELVYVRNRGNDAPPLLLDAARCFEGLDDALARETYLEAFGAVILTGDPTTHPNLREVAETARRSRVDIPVSRPIDLMLDGVVMRFTEGHAPSVPTLRSALEVFRRHAEDGGVHSTRWFWLAWLLAGELWDFALQEELAARAVTLARDTGALAHLPTALVYRAGAHVNAGEFGAALALIEEASSIASAIGQAPLGYAASLLLAWRGDEVDATNRFALAAANAAMRGTGRTIRGLGYAAAILYSGLGRYEEALAGARTACGYDDLGFHGVSLVELIEAAARAGFRDEAADALRALEERTLSTDTDWALGILARSRALLTSAESADAQYLESIERLGRTRLVVDLARAHLLFGEWLRRENRRLDARHQLRRAHELFSDMGAGAFAERARRELAATGETVRRRSVDTVDALTPQEAQVARLAADGESNPEIGSRLFLSPRTVEYHLSKVFVKLGVKSRRELRSVLR